jgi:hypothetical protein
MDFIEKLQALSAKIQKQKDAIQTEEGTKNAFILPFISALGYDIFDPMEVVPEFTADVGIKKGEKVDYAILRDGDVIMLVECKPCNAALAEAHASQLYRYFSVTAARIAVLTDGITYLFFTDLEEKNKMDSKPFMEFHMLDIQEHLVSELKRLTKQAFNLDEILTVAGEMKYTREIKKLIAEQVASPSEEYVRFFASQVYSGKLTQAWRDHFTAITKKAFVQFLNDTINDRLRSAMAAATDTAEVQSSESSPEATPEDAVGRGSGIVTTEEELQGLYVVRAILCESIDPNRVVHRDTHNYFGILLDNTNRKPICRLYFDRKQKQVGLFNESKQEERMSIDGLNDLYKYADRLRAVVAFYETHHSGSTGQQAVPE